MFSRDFHLVAHHGDGFLRGFNVSNFPGAWLCYSELQALLKVSELPDSFTLRVSQPGPHKLCAWSERYEDPQDLRPDDADLIDGQARRAAAALKLKPNLVFVDNEALMIAEELGLDVKVGVKLELIP